MKKSLARQFGLFTACIIVMFCATFAVYLWDQNRNQAAYELENSKLKQKEKLAVELDYAFNNSISEIRAYFAFGDFGKNKTYYEKALEQKTAIAKKLDELKKASSSNDDKSFLKASQGFYTYYFSDAMPRSVRLYEARDPQAVTKIAVNQNGTNKVREFQKSLQVYRQDIASQLENNDDDYSDRNGASQFLFSGIILLLLVILLIVIRNILNKLNKPLNDLTHAAKEIAAGEEVIFQRTINREDELGLLHKAFEKMSRNIVEKEQDLNAQNEELLAQQDELQAQQIELENAIETMRDREAQLRLRNELVHGISNTLNKQELLKSIVSTMTDIVRAEKGLIITMDGKKDFASYGASDTSIAQFINHSDARERLMETKTAFSIKRGAANSEKDYHGDEFYSYDLYLPIISAEETVEAMMLFTRYGDAYTRTQIDNYAGLAKNIALSLEKIKLFEQSESDRVLNQEIMDTVHEGIQFVDSEGKILLINKKIKSIYQDAEEVLINGLSFAHWTCWFKDQIEDYESVKDFLNRTVLSDTEDENNTIIFHLSHTSNVIQVYVEPLYRGKQRIGTVIVHRDITKEYEVDQMKSEFVSTVSHELRTPLASVLGFTELMLNRELKPERQKKYLSTIYQEAKRLTSLINDFLDVQRMEAGKQAYEKRYEEVTAIAESVIESQKIQAANHEIVLEKLTEQTMVLGDKDKIAQVFTNLISNAVKYSPDGGKVSVSIYEEGKKLKIKVEDEGLGIPDEAMDKLFTKFYRVDNSDRRRIGGTGLGLAIVKEIMKAHDGTISAVSKLGEGSTFTAEFPLVLSTSDSDPEDKDDSSEKRTNVIIVEDDLNLANLLKTELEESQFGVKIFTSGKAALEQMQIEHPDALVLDIMLDDPAFTGWDLLTKLKEDKTFSQLPIFISSALDEKEKGMALGANDYLVKPYQPSMLSKLILQTLLQKDWHGQILIPLEYKD